MKKITTLLLAIVLTFIRHNSCAQADPHLPMKEYSKVRQRPPAPSPSGWLCVRILYTVETGGLVATTLISPRTATGPKKDMPMKPHPLRCFRFKVAAPLFKTY